MKRLILAAIALTFFAISVYPAMAEKRTITVGGEISWVPEFSGSDTYKPSVVPRFGLRKAGEPAAFWMPSDSAGFALYEDGGLSAGPVLSLVSRRRGADIGTGFRDIKYGAELGAYGQYWLTSWLRARVETRTNAAATDRINGHVSLTATAPVLVPMGSHFQLVQFSIGPVMRFGNAEYNAVNFGVSEGSRIGGNAVGPFAPRGGIRSVGAETMALVPLSPALSSYWYGKYERIVGSAADSPIVTARGNENQFETGVGVLYSFNADLPF